MQYVNFLGFNLFQVKLFLTLAETLNFTEAANRCSVTQSAMSRNIKALEEALGIRLLDRSTRRVRLTPAGRSLYTDWKDFYGYMERAVYKGAQIQSGNRDVLNLGFSMILNILPELHPFLRRFHRAHPEIEISLVRYPEEQTLERLLQREIDVMFSYLPAPVEDPDIEILPVASSPTVLYMLHDNPLAQKKDLSLADLQGQKVIVRMGSQERNHSEFIRDLFAKYNIEPRLKGVFGTVDDILLNLCDTDEVCVFTCHHPERFNPLYCKREVDGPRYTLYMLWRKNEPENGAAKRFVRELIPEPGKGIF